MTFEWGFLFSKFMRIAMQSHPSLYYVMYLGTNSFAVQCSVFIGLLWFSFSDAGGNKHSYLVEIAVKLLKVILKKKAFQDHYD